ncbi:MAG TPA: hypothetical protein GXX69_05350 [Firmicutes bacterium]|nr:hypothetical protein [Bacillota bacterium]
MKNRLEGERWLKDAELVSGIAHEIKNPLTVIRGFLQLLAERVTDDARSSHYVAMIFNELSWLEELVEDCLCFGHIKEVSFSFCDLGAMLDQVAAKATRVAESRDINIKVETAPCPQAQVAPKLLQQLLWNLVTNALAALSADGEILLGLTQVSDDWLRITCKDTGTGISPSVCSRIFHPYFTTKEDGTGLGLPLCQRIAELHGGRLEVESELGSGTILSLWLPICQDSIAK